MFGVASKQCVVRWRWLCEGEDIEGGAEETAVGHGSYDLFVRDSYINSILLVSVSYVLT